MSLEFNQSFIEQFEGRTEEELNKILKEKETILYKIYEHNKTYTGYFDYDRFRVNVKVEDGIVIQVAV